jgi:hypothetical protein
MTLTRKIKHAFRGRVSPGAALFEIGRRGWVALRSRYERSVQSFEGAGVGRSRVAGEFANMPTLQLLEHFRDRSSPRFFPGFEVQREKQSELQHREFPADTKALLETARGIVSHHRWTLLGFGELNFGDPIAWLRDPVSGAEWLPDTHSDAGVSNTAGADIRVLWELNRMGHLITLARAHAVTGDDSFAEECFAHVEGWLDHNRPGLGPNWNCTMEVGLRAMNLLAMFQLLRRAKSLTEGRLTMMLTLFEQHGRYIRGHLEFSYIATSNHYLSDVVALFWLGICLPELEQAHEWRDFGLREMLREMDKQVLPDGAHYESSTGYHRFVLELFLYSFVLCRTNSITIEDKYWKKLRSMIDYVRAYLRPDGRAPLIGDTDSGQVMPIASHTAADHLYLLSIAAAVFEEPSFKVTDEVSPELLWLLGETGLRTFERLPTLDQGSATSASFPDAGTFILRHRDLYLMLNASGSGLLGRGAHGHNDVLSLEVAACGTSFISDPGTYVYSGDLALRHQFRSTAYHSSVEVDGREQNTIDARLPFYIGDEAGPAGLRWETGEPRDLVVAEHYGYQNLPNGRITHRRAVVFEKNERFWLVEDSLMGVGQHRFRFCFHVTPGLEILPASDGLTEIRDNKIGARLIVAPLNVEEKKAEVSLLIGEAEGSLLAGPVLEPRWFSRDYGEKSSSVAMCWTMEAQAPLRVRWLLVPICAEDDAEERLGLAESLRVTPRSIEF